MTHYRNCECYDCRQSRLVRDRRIRLAVAAACVVIGVLILVMLFGCSSTVTPAPVESHQASFDQGEQNSGILSLVPEGAVITAHARDRYNGLIAIYGRDFLPSITADYGITPHGADFLITREALQKFIVMNTWHRSGREPKTK